MMQKKYKRVLTIAGSDSGGGAGIQADIKTITMLNCYAMSVITVLTAQNTKEVAAIYEVSPSFVGEQITSALSDIGTDAIKIGMVYSKEIIEVVAKKISTHSNIVLDPVMISKSNHALLSSDSIEALKTHLIPIATILTPNLPEAESLIGQKIFSKDQDIKNAIEKIVKLGATSVLLKGGHMDSNDCKDYLFVEGKFYTLSSPRVQTKNTHGTGCTLSSAIACFLAKEHSIFDAVFLAKEYLTKAIESGARYTLGSGNAPVNHFFSLD